ncbi:hypothetical protein TEA_026941 [Camellia sinensis var. sinensis]|uniref:BZIP domain-containing protein n=1 Tax=Camellia sinensis var. sinensis TaxID=542762 RepID=A0A4S4F1I7_CAMSN|nr:hypothetical protein TEA_026941 [Camellia sinensis var. sinensis]
MGYRAVFSPSRVHGPHFPILHNLTLDQLGNSNLTKPLNNMDLVELVKNEISADEEGQSMQNPSSSSSSSSSSIFLGNLNLNGTLSRKTMDEVWKEIAHQEHVNATDEIKSVHQQLALGETTIEDILARAGVINTQPFMGIDPMVVVSQQADWFKFPMASVHHNHHHQQQQQQQMTMPILSVVDSNFQVSELEFETPGGVDVGCHSENQLGLPMPMPMPMVPASCSLESQMGIERKRSFTDEMMEKTIERRQKRMIKNRESAARSRARKQAYTNQLEHEVFQLRKTNSWLKKKKDSKHATVTALTTSVTAPSLSSLQTSSSLYLSNHLPLMFPHVLQHSRPPIDRA